MRLTPHEQERLMIHVAAGVAKDRRARGLRLNQPEAVAMLSSFIFEGARDGRTVSDLMDAGRHVLCVDDVMEGIADLVPEVQVEATFPDGTKLVTLHDPIGPGTPGGAAGSEAGEMAAAPGTVWTPDQPIVLNLGRGTLHLVVVNAGDRPIQVGSHYHFAEANPGLEFDRQAAHGHRLDIPAGTAVRFEPGVNRTVDLVPLTGTRTVWGLRGEVAGPLDDPIVHTSTREPTDG